MKDDSNLGPNEESRQPSGEDAHIVGTSETESKVPPIARAVQRYLSSILQIAQTAAIALPHITTWASAEADSLQKKIEKFVPRLPNQGEGPVSITLESPRELAEFTNTIRQLEDFRGNNSAGILAKSLFTQLFAEYDSYSGELLKVIYLKNNQLLKGISREISLTDLLDFDDINAVKLSMLDKEIETFRRDSYIEQFCTLEKKFGVPLRKFKEWPQFVELSQRRNILTHNGGLVSDQYLAMCDREGYKFDSRPKIGDSLGVSIEYFGNATRLLSKVGLMLAFTLWSKVFPKELSELHSALNDIIYHCLQHERWIFVSQLDDFVLGEPMRKGISEIDLRIRIINASIGLKFSGKDAEAAKLMESVDWTASYRDFKLALAVLSENYEIAVKLMKSIGKSGEIIDQTSYHTWPLFARFRERPEFYESYFDVYGEPFAEKVETEKGHIEAHAKAGDTDNSHPSIRDVTDVEPKVLPATSEIKLPKASKSRSRKRPGDGQQHPLS